MAIRSERFVPKSKAWLRYHRPNLTIWTKSTTNSHIYFLYFSTFSTFPAQKECLLSRLAPLWATKSERQATKSERQATKSERQATKSERQATITRLFNVAFLA